MIDGYLTLAYMASGTAIFIPDLVADPFEPCH